MKKLISYVLPVFNEAASISEFFSQLQVALKKIESKYEFELLFVNDGSSDESEKILRQLQARDRRIQVINFSRNFGHQAAITAGIDIARGDAIIIMDTDLQDPPDVSLDLIEKWREGFDVVYAQRKKRIDNIFKLWAIHIHYRLLRLMSDLEIPVDTGDFRLIDKRAAIELRKFREQSRYMRGLVVFLGFKQTALQYDRKGRYAGKSNYPFNKLVALSLNGITSFSTKPLEIIGRFGFVMFAVSVMGIIYVLAVRLLYPQTAIPGWAFITITILLLSGVQFITLGVMSEYIGRIYKEVQNRPLYIISENTNKLDDEPIKSDS